MTQGDRVSSLPSARLTRRRFLGTAAAAGAVAALGGCGGGGRSAQAAKPLAAPGSRPFPRLPEGTDTIPQIDHIVVLMMENHSFDNYLGTLGRGDGFTVGPDGRPTAANTDATGKVVRAFTMPTTCQQQNHPSQNWNDSHIQWDGGRNDGFVRSGSGPVAMGYWTAADLPFYHGLARTFPLGDRYFASVLAQTYPNRRYLLAATSWGQVSDPLPAPTDPPPPNGTIFDRLDAHHITWKNYYTNLPTTDLVPSLAARDKQNIVPIDRFYSDAAGGTLPGYSIVDADFVHASEEDPQDVVVGEAFSAKVINAVMSGPAWGKTLLVWTYDEHGGYYDHVPPPPAPLPDSIPPAISPTDQPGRFDRYGFRVPCVVVSPYARRNHVSHVVADHTSILKLVETKWNLPAMTYRDANASNLLDFVDLRSAPAFREPPALPAPNDNAATEACLATGPGQIPPP
jgi:phospholipase C